MFGLFGGASFICAIFGVLTEAGGFFAGTDFGRSFSKNESFAFRRRAVFADAFPEDEAFPTAIFADAVDADEIRVGVYDGGDAGGEGFKFGESFETDFENGESDAEAAAQADFGDGVEALGGADIVGDKVEHMRRVGNVFQGMRKKTGWTFSSESAWRQRQTCQSTTLRRFIWTAFSPKAKRRVTNFS